MTSTVLFTALIVAVGLERLAELVVSTRHTRWARDHGGVEVGQGPRLLARLHERNAQPVVGIVEVDGVTARPEALLGLLVARIERFLELRDRLGVPSPPDELPSLQKRASGGIGG